MAARHRAPTICGQPGCANDQPCPDHAPKPWRNNTERRPTALRGRARQQRNARILHRDHHRCQAATHDPRCDGTATEVDHVIPLAEGGPETDNNLAAINTRCNALKARTDGR